MKTALTTRGVPAFVPGGASQSTRPALSLGAAQEAWTKAHGRAEEWYARRAEREAAEIRALDEALARFTPHG